MEGMSSVFYLLFMMVILFGSIYFMQRSQRKQRQEKLLMLKNLKKGDKVITIGGMHGIVVAIDEDEDEVALRSGDIRLVFERSAINAVVKPKGAKGLSTAESSAGDRKGEKGESSPDVQGD